MAILAAARPNEPLRPGEWAAVIVNEGLATTLFTSNDRSSDRGRERAVGTLFCRNLDETFDVGTESTPMSVRLTGATRRWESGREPHRRYAFEVLGEEVELTIVA